MTIESRIDTLQENLANVRFLLELTIALVVSLIVLLGALWIFAHTYTEALCDQAFEIKKDDDSKFNRISAEIDQNYSIASSNEDLSHKIYSDIIETYNYVNFVDSKLVRIANHLGLEMTVTTDKEIKEAGFPGDPE